MKTRIILALAMTAGMTTSALAETHVIEAYSTSFVPSVVDAMPGDTIRWEYNTGYPHSVTSGTGCTYDGLYFNEYPLSTFEWIVPDDAPAQVPFFCDPHCNMGMEGVINVLPATDPGRLVFGIMDMADVYVDFGVVEQTGVGNLWIESNQGHFSMGFEVEDGDIDIEFDIDAGNLYKTDAGGTSAVADGTMTMAEGSRFAIHGEDGVEFTMSWQDEIGDKGADFVGIECFECSVNINGDMASFRTTADGSYLEFRGEGEITMSVIGDVTSSSLTLPGFGEEADVYIPAGLHTIDLNATTGDDDLAWLLMQMGGGDDGGGEGCPEDVNDDGIVNVNDLLAIIGAWGTTCP